MDGLDELPRITLHERMRGSRSIILGGALDSSRRRWLQRRPWLRPRPIILLLGCTRFNGYYHLFFRRSIGSKASFCSPPRRAQRTPQIPPRASTARKLLVTFRFGLCTLAAEQSISVVLFYDWVC